MSPALPTSIAIAIASTVATATAQVSEYFLMTGDQATFHVVQNGVLVRSWGIAAGTDDYQYPIAVAGTVRAMGADTADIGAEYDLNGNDLGTRFVQPGSPVGRCWDGTTDGLNNYAIDTGGMVWRFDHAWANPAALFDAGGIGSVTYDPVNQTLWVGQFGTSTITEYSLGGTVVSSFTTGHTKNMALALDHADGTLWLHDRNAQGTFEQWTRSGTMLQRIAVAGMSGENVLGGEMQYLGSASCTFRNGSGVNPPDYSCVTPPILGSGWVTSFNDNPNTLFTVLVLALAPATFPSPVGGEALVSLTPAPATVLGTGDITVPVPANPVLVGTALASQGVRIDAVGAAAQFVLLNAQDFVVGY